MRFRPCIDIHNGKVKQIVGGSLKDQGDAAETNFASELGADYYAKMYRKDGLRGGHIILLNPVTSEYYEATKAQAMRALSAYPQGMQIGGGITAENAQEYLDAGASHVIVTSYVFQGEHINWENLKKLVAAVGKERVVLDLSCRKRVISTPDIICGRNEEHPATESEKCIQSGYYIVTNRWQTFTDVKLTEEVLDELADYCDEFLVHGVDVEGKASGVEMDLVKLLADWAKIPITYAGGIGSEEDLEAFHEMSGGRLDFTIGSALDLFGGTIPYDKLVE